MLTNQIHFETVATPWLQYVRLNTGASFSGGWEMGRPDRQLLLLECHWSIPTVATPHPPFSAVKLLSLLLKWWHLIPNLFNTLPLTSYGFIILIAGCGQVLLGV